MNGDSGGDLPSYFYPGGWDIGMFAENQRERYSSVLVSFILTPLDLGVGRVSGLN